jgi:hypothetical protein
VQAIEILGDHGFHTLGPVRMRHIKCPVVVPVIPEKEAKDEPRESRA